MEEEDLLSDSDSDTGLQNGAARGLPLLPTHRPPKTAIAKTENQIRLGNVWDESEELFDIGDDEDEDEHIGRRSDDTLRPSGVKISITAPS